MALFRPVTREGWHRIKELQHEKMVVEVPKHVYESRNREGLDTAIVGWLLAQLERGVVWLMSSIPKLISWSFKVLFREIARLLGAIKSYRDRIVCEWADRIRACNERI